MIEFSIVQEGLIEITEAEGVKDSRPTSSLLSLDGFHVLVDLEHPKEDGVEFKQALADLGLSMSDVRGVILTHLHPDHIGHKNLFPAAHFMYQGAEKLAFYFKDDPSVRLDGDFFVDLCPRGFLRPLRVDRVPNLRELDDRLFVHAIPGHTRGSQVIFACIGGRVHAWAGDTFLNKGYFDRWETPGSSWRPEIVPEHMQFIKDHADIIIPGHGAPFAVP